MSWSEGLRLDFKKDFLLKRWDGGMVGWGGGLKLRIHVSDNRSSLMEGVLCAVLCEVLCRQFPCDLHHDPAEHGHSG